MRIRHQMRLGVLFAAIGLLIGCTSGEQTLAPDTSDTGKFQLLLVDAPAAFDDLILDVQGVSVHNSDPGQQGGWYEVGLGPTEYHLLDLTNGLSALISDAELASGPYNQVRLLLGENNRVVVAGQEHALYVPSGSESGLKVRHEFYISAEKAYQATMDVDVSRSVHLTGEGSYILRPVVRVQANESAGNIAGTVWPPSARARAWVATGTDTVSTFADPVTGGFQLTAVPVGTYTLNVDPTVDGYYSTMVIGVSVEAETTYDVGWVFLSSF